VILAIFLLAAGVLAGLARGGRLTNIAQAKLRLPGLIFVGLGLQIAGELAAAFVYPELRSGAGGLALLAISYAFLIAFLLINIRLPGTALIGLGLALNLAVILLNGGMPVSADASRAAGTDSAQFLEASVKHVPMGPDTDLWFLGDVIPLPGFRTVISAGDVILGVGVFLLVQRLVAYHPRRLVGRRNLKEQSAGGG
jgi:hypothetical protein